MQLHNRRILKSRRKKLRNHGTSAEAVLWNVLKKSQLHGRKFRRQHSIGRFIVDFYCPVERLIVEVDGPIHDHPVRAAYDARRTAYLERLGFRLIRIRNEDVFASPEAAAAYIATFFLDDSPAKSLG